MRGWVAIWRGGMSSASAAPNMTRKPAPLIAKHQPTPSDVMTKPPMMGPMMRATPSTLLTLTVAVGRSLETTMMPADVVTAPLLSVARAVIA